MTELYTAEEVARHNSEKDLWIVIHGSVFDLTKFLKEHPGGEEVLIDLAGQDGTTCFDEIGHSAEAIELRDSFKIGKVIGTLESKTSPADVGTRDTPIDDDNWEYEEPKYEKTPWLPAIIGAGIVVYAYIFYYFWLS